MKIYWMGHNDIHTSRRGNRSGLLLGTYGSIYSKFRAV